MITKNVAPGYLVSGGSGVFTGGMGTKQAQECLVLQSQQPYAAPDAVKKHARPTIVDVPTTGIPPAFWERCP
jgi:hypothetical protein